MVWNDNSFIIFFKKTLQPRGPCLTSVLFGISSLCLDLYSNLFSWFSKFLIINYVPQMKFGNIFCFLLCFLFIIKVFCFQRKTLLLFFGFFFSIIIFFFLLHFSKKAWTEFLKIFKVGADWSGKNKNHFSCDNVPSAPRYRRFSDFQGVFLFSDYSFLIKICDNM